MRYTILAERHRNPHQGALVCREAVFKEPETRRETWLRWSERCLKTDVRYLMRGGSWLGLGQLAASLSSFTLAILFANLIPKETYGTYKYVLSVVSMLSAFTLTGINTPLAQGIARGKEGAFLTSLRVKIRWGMLGLIASIALALYYYFAGNAALAFAFFIAGIFIPLMDPLGLYNVYLQSKKLFGEAIRYYAVSQGIATAIMAAALYFSGNLFLILTAYFASWTALRYFFHRITMAKFPPNAEDDPEIIAQGKHLSFIGVLTNVVSNIDSFLIFHFLGAAPVALYTLATAPIDQLRASFKNVAPLALPKLTHRSIKEINGLLVHRLVILFAIGFGTAALYAFAAPILFPILFPKYVTAIPISIAFAFTLCLQLPLTFFTAVGQSKIHLIPKSWFYWSNVPQSLLILSAVLFIPLFGLWGVIVSVYLQIIAALVIVSIQWNMLTRRHA